MMKVALYIPCFVDQLMPHIAMDTVRVLRRIGCTVEFPEDQTCCGQPPYNAGYWDDARPCAEHFARVFAPYEYIVCPSGSCTSMVRTHYPDLLEHHPARQQAIDVGRRVYELTEFLVRVAKVNDVGATFPHSVTYHVACHANRELGIADAARVLLNHVRGIDLRELKAADECCGFGGAFSVKMGMISAAMGDTKCGYIEQSGAEYVTAVDPSCLMHIDGVLRRTKRAPRAIHVASILAQEAR